MDSLYVALPEIDSPFLVDGVVDIILLKGVTSETWWDCVQVGHPKIDVKAIDGAKYLDDSILKKIYAQVCGPGQILAHSARNKNRKKLMLRKLPQLKKKPLVPRNPRKAHKSGTGITLKRFFRTFVEVKLEHF